MKRRIYCGHTRKEYNKRKKRRQRRDWHRSEFNNPYFAKQQPINLKPYLYSFLVVSIIVFLSYVFLFLDYWRINSISIKTNNQTYREKIQTIIDNSLNAKILEVLSGANYFLFNSRLVAEEIQSELLVKDLKIDKKLPNKIIVDFQEIQPAYIWIQSGKFYHIDEKAMVMNEVVSMQEADSAPDNPDTQNLSEFNLEEIKNFLRNSNANLNLPIIYNESGLALKARDYITDKDIFDLINSLNPKINQRINSDVILYKIDSNNFKKVEAITEDGWKIYFDAENNLGDQLENLHSLMQNTFKDSQPAEYVDLRYGNKVYYK